jgi:hypothetical protein
MFRGLQLLRFKIELTGDDFCKSAAAHSSLAVAHTAPGQGLYLIWLPAAFLNGLPNIAGGHLFTTANNGLVTDVVEPLARLVQRIDKRAGGQVRMKRSFSSLGMVSALSLAGRRFNFSAISRAARAPLIMAGMPP